MATGGYTHVDKLPNISEEEDPHNIDQWEHVLVSNRVSNGGLESPTSKKYDDEESDYSDEEVGVQATADEDYTPTEAGCVELLKGDVVIIQGQTIDREFYSIYNLRTAKSGLVPCNIIAIRPEGDKEVISAPPTKSNLQRGNVIRRKRSSNNNLDKSRRTGSDFTSSFPGTGVPYHGLEPDPFEQAMSQENVTKSLTDLIGDNKPGKQSVTYTDADASVLPMRFKRIEKHEVLTVSGADKMGRPVVVFSACRLPPSYQISHDVLFDYIKYTLDKYVESDYSLVYFHYGLSSVNKPSYGWLYQFYKELDRKYKKNLKRLYIVHPTTFVKFMIGLFRPVISYKFGKKLVYVNRLAELESALYTSQLDIPKVVSDYDRTLRVQPRPFLTTESRSSFYVGMPDEIGTKSNLQFGVDLKILKEQTGEDIPHVMRICMDYLTINGLTVLGIFRRTPSQFTVQEVKKKFNSGETVDFNTYQDPHLAATILKMFLRELPEPLLCFDTNAKISHLRFVPDDEKVSKAKEIIESLPPLNYTILNYLLSFIIKIIEQEEVNKMSSANLSIVFGPNLLWLRNEVASLSSMSEANRFTLLLLDNYSNIFRTT